MDNKLKLFYQNVRGVRTKTLQFSKNLLTVDYDLLFITETWLIDSVLDSELTDSRYHLFRRDRKSDAHGGIMVLCKVGLNARARPEWERRHFDVECLWISIDGRAINSDKDLHVGLVYMPPGNQLPQRVTKLNEWVSEVAALVPNDYFMILGDFNLYNIKWNESLDPEHLKKGTSEFQTAGTNLINLTNMLGLSQFSNYLNASGNTLDLVFSNFHVVVNKCLNPLVTEDSNHVTLDIDASDIKVKPLAKVPHMKYLFRKANYVEINEAFTSLDWSILNQGTVDDAVSIFYDKVNSIISKYVPQATVNGSNHFPVWYTKALININNEKNKVHARWKRYKNPLDYDEFSLLRTRFKNIEATCYLDYISRTEDAIKSNPKLLWSYVNAKRKSATGYPSSMSYRSKTVTDSVDILESFNSFFQNMFVQPANYYPADMSINSSSSQDTVNTIVISEEQILKLLRKLDTKKGAGSDRIHPFFIMKCSDTLFKPITIIFNRSIKEGVFPCVWKEAHIVPLHKKGSKMNVENYRPISILNVLSKCFERIIYDTIYPVIRHGIPEQQHGFVKGRSTTTNLSLFISDVLSGMESRAQVDVIYTDFEKAFDRVDHVILLRKLHELGIQGDLLRWMKSYVSNRRQAVVIGGARSNFIYVPSGVPQGSLLGPLLYLAYLYDIGTCFKHAKFLLFADDKKIYYNVRSIDDCIHIQNDLDRLSTYYLNNRISVNVGKCMHVCFTRSNDPISYTYKINNHTIEKVNSVRDLGVLLDHKLTFSTHIEYIINRAYKNLGFIMRVTAPFKSTSCLKILYYAYIRSVLEYCSTVWNPQYVTYDNAIESIQRKFVKYLNFRSSMTYESYDSSCRVHGLMSLRNRRTVQDMALLHDACTGFLDCSSLLNKMLTLRSPNYRTRHTQLFFVPTHRTNYAANSVTSRLPQIYNKKFSDIDIFDIRSKKVFKSRVCASLLNK